MPASRSPQRLMKAARPAMSRVAPGTGSWDPGRSMKSTWGSTMSNSMRGSNILISYASSRSRNASRIARWSSISSPQARRRAPVRGAFPAGVDPGKLRQPFQPVARRIRLEPEQDDARVRPRAVRGELGEAVPDLRLPPGDGIGVVAQGEEAQAAQFLLAEACREQGDPFLEAEGVAGRRGQPAAVDQHRDPIRHLEAPAEAAEVRPGRRLGPSDADAVRILPWCHGPHSMLCGELPAGSGRAVKRPTRVWRKAGSRRTPTRARRWARMRAVGVQHALGPASGVKGFVGSGRE